MPPDRGGSRSDDRRRRPARRQSGEARRSRSRERERERKRRCDVNRRDRDLGGQDRDCDRRRERDRQGTQERDRRRRSRNADRQGGGHALGAHGNNPPLASSADLADESAKETTVEKSYKSKLAVARQAKGFAALEEHEEEATVENNYKSKLAAALQAKGVADLEESDEEATVENNYKSQLAAALQAKGVAVEEEDEVQSIEQMRISVCFGHHLSDDDWDPDFDKMYDSGFNVRRRGKEECYLPSKGWTKLGLNVLHRYPDQEWLGKKWPIVYHGTSATPAVVKSIVREGLKIRGGAVCAKNGERLGSGIYCSPQISKAMRYADVPVYVDGIPYMLVFQCRVRPQEYSKPEKDVWLVKNTSDIRPCGILLHRFLFPDDQAIEYIRNPHRKGSKDWEKGERLLQVRTVREARACGRDIVGLNKDYQRHRLRLVGARNGGGRSRSRHGEAARRHPAGGRGARGGGRDCGRDDRDERGGRGCGGDRDKGRSRRDRGRGGGGDRARSRSRSRGGRGGRGAGDKDRDERDQRGSDHDERDGGRGHDERARDDRGRGIRGREERDRDDQRRDDRDRSRDDRDDRKREDRDRSRDGRDDWRREEAKAAASSSSATSVVGVGVAAICLANAAQLTGQRGGAKRETKTVEAKADEIYVASHTSSYTDAVAKDKYDTLDEVLAEKLKDTKSKGMVNEFLDACVKITEALRVNLMAVSDASDAFGDRQLSVDMIVDDLLWDLAKSSPLVCGASSEEEPAIVKTNPDGQFVLCWDPLDGSSIGDNKWVVGTIVDVWDKSTGLVGAIGKDPVMSFVVLYGPRTTVFMTLDDGFCEFTLGPDMQWMCSRERIEIKKDCNIFAPANMRAAQDVDGFSKLIAHAMTNSYALPCSGGMVTDVCQQFTTGLGVFTNPTSTSSPAKLPLAFEAEPF